MLNLTELVIDENHGTLLRAGHYKLIVGRQAEAHLIRQLNIGVLVFGEELLGAHVPYLDCTVSARCNQLVLVK